jgi:hypothetical protein
MRKPNFFLIGAPKCGTTSIAAWLAEHPQVYFSPVKEPMYFATDAQIRTIVSLEAYEQLFAGATSRHLAIGEGSTEYLRSSIALRQIMTYAGSPRFIASVRNPVEMASSFHQQVCFNGDEDVRDFEEAWRLQKPRERGE